MILSQDICSILVIFTDGFPLFSKLQFQFHFFWLSSFAPIIGKSEALQHMMVLPRYHGNNGNNQDFVYEMSDHAKFGIYHVYGL